MTGKRWVSLMIVFVMVFSLVNPAMLFAEGDNEETRVHREDEIYEELIVAIDHSEEAGEIQQQNITNVAELHEELLNKQGLDIKDASLNSVDFEEMKTLGLNPSELIEERIRQSGHVYLISNKNGEKSLEVLREELNTELEASGLSLRYLEPNYSISIDENAFDEVLETTSTLNPNQQPHYDMVHLEQAWEIATGSMDLRIAVLDSGIDHTHESLSNFIDPNLGKNFSVDGVVDDTMDYNGHGTHVSGTIASYNQVDGMMKGATLIPIKVVDNNGNGTYYEAQQGIYHAVAMGAKVINMSLGGQSYSQAFEDACNYAVTNGLVVVAAAGNQNNSQLDYPARFESVISVGAVNLQGERAYFSNYGPGLDVMAPGVGVYSTFPGNQYAYMQGTSMAAPHVAGLTGLMLSLDPGVSVNGIRSVLHESSAYSSGVNAFEYGYGLVNAHAALTALADFQEEEIGGPDVTPPEVQLETLEVNQSVAYPGDTLEVKVKATDKESGVEYVNFSFENEHGSTLDKYVRIEDAEGYYSWNIPIDENTHSGKWSLRWITTKDHNENIRRYFSSSYDLSAANFQVYPPGIPINTLKDTYVTKTTTWSYKTIEGDLYIGPEAVLTINGDVKVNGNIYVLGALLSYGDLTAKEIHGTRVYFGWLSSPFANGTVNIRGGSNNFTGTYVSNQPIPNIPLNILNDLVVNEQGVIERIEGETLPIAELYLDGVKQEYFFNGTFIIENHYVGYSDEIIVKMNDVFGATHEYRIAIAEPMIPELERVEIKSLPALRDYYVAQPFDGEGLMVKGYYSDGSDRVIPLEDLTIEGFNSVNPETDQIITIQYEGFQQTFTVTIHASGTPIVELAEATSVNIGAALSESLLEGVFKDPYTGETVEGNLQWKDPNTIVLDTREHPWMFTPQKEWHETVEGTVEVKGVPVLTGMEIVTEPIKTQYLAEESLNLEGMVVQASHNDDTTKTIPHEELTIKGFDSSLPTEAQEITVSYEGFSDSFQITISVIEPDLEKISASPVVLGDRLIEATLTGVFKDPRNGEVVEGTLIWKDETLEITDAKESFKWIFTPNSAIFSTVEGTLEVIGHLPETAKRIAGDNRYLTAYEIAKFNDPNPDTVIIVRGDSAEGIPQVVDGLTASGLAGAMNAQILMVSPNRIPNSTWEALDSLAPKNVIIVGGEAAVGAGVQQALENYGLAVSRVSGDNRYDTGAQVGLVMGAARDNTAIIVNGHAVVDSLVAGALAHKGYPILMVNNARGRIPAETQAAMKALNIEKVWIVGGTGVVSKDIEDQLNALPGVTVDARFGGNSRVETSLSLAGHPVFNEGRQVTIVNGWSYVDAVAASTLGAPVIYYRERSGITQDIEAYLTKKDGFKVIGGDQVVSGEIYRRLEEIMQ